MRKCVSLGFFHMENQALQTCEKKTMFPNMYPKARFLGKDDRFRKDMMYLLHFANVYERRMLLNSVNIHMKMKVSSGNITVGHLHDFDYKTN